MPKDPKKLLSILMIVAIVIALAALAVGIVALAKQQYIIAAAMLLVAVWQVVNFFKWKNSYKDRTVRRDIQSHSYRAPGTCQLFVRI